MPWLFTMACTPDSPVENDMPASAFQHPIEITLTGYDGEAMGPFISRDGQYLFFNNLNNPEVNTNLHWCSRINDTVFQYEGELNRINTPALEGVPTMDQNGIFYYVFTGEYNETLSTIYTGIFTDGNIDDITLVDNISRLEGGWVNFDV